MNKTRTFTKEFIVVKLGLPASYDDDECKVLVDKVYDTDRWSIHYQLVFKYEDIIYETYYSVGATEMQDEEPWEEDEYVVCTEVEEFKREIVDYRPVKVVDSN